MRVGVARQGHVTRAGALDTRLGASCSELVWDINWDEVVLGHYEDIWFYSGMEFRDYVVYGILGGRELGVE